MFSGQRSEKMCRLSVSNRTLQTSEMTRAAVTVSNSAKPLTTLTFVRPRNAKMWIVVERRKEMFIRSPDITHPFQQVFRLATVKRIVDKRATQCGMSGTFGNEEFVRRFIFQRRRSPVLVSPDKHCPHNRAAETIYSRRVAHNRVVTQKTATHEISSVKPVL